MWFTRLRLGKPVNTAVKVVAWPTTSVMIVSANDPVLAIGYALDNDVVTVESVIGVV